MLDGNGRISEIYFCGVAQDEGAEDCNGDALDGKEEGGEANRHLSGVASWWQK